jgi:hypothetical protein
MELIEVIKSSLLIFFSLISITGLLSYITYKIKDKARERSSRHLTIQVEETPVSGIYPRMLSVNYYYKIPGKTEESLNPRRNVFSFYSFNLSDAMHKLRLLSK